VGKFTTFSERPKAKSVSAIRGLCRPYFLTRGSALNSAGGFAPRAPILGASHLYLVGGAPTLWRRHCRVPACRTGRVHLCRVAGNTVWSHTADDAP